MTEAYPLQWPQGWPRTPPGERDHYLAGHDHRNSQNWSKVTHRLLHELRLLRVENVIVSTNQPLRRDGLPYAATRRIDDPGAAVYFDLDGRALVLAQDRYWPLVDNLRSIALAIEGMRKMQRHGGDHMMERAFTGFAALPPPAEGQKWWRVLGVQSTCTLNAARLAYRDLAHTYHPDSPDGGDAARMAEINRAWEEAQQALA